MRTDDYWLTDIENKLVATTGERENRRGNIGLGIFLKVTMELYEIM